MPPGLFLPKHDLKKNQDILRLDAPHNSHRHIRIVYTKILQFAICKSGTFIYARPLGGGTRPFVEPLAFACNLTKSLDEARDLVQEANFRVLRSWNQYDPLRSFSAWYLTIITAISGYFQTAKTAHFKNGVPRNIAISNSCADDTPGTV